MVIQFQGLNLMDIQELEENSLKLLQYLPST